MLRDDIRSMFGHKYEDEISDEEQKRQRLKSSFRDMNTSPVGKIVFKSISKFCGENEDLFATTSMQDMGWDNTEMNLYLQGRNSVILMIREMIAIENKEHE